MNPIIFRENEIAFSILSAMIKDKRIIQKYLTDIIDSYITIHREEKSMDKLVEFLTKKVGYVLAVILGFIAPGNVLLFAWDRNLYLEMDVVKLLILSFSISFITFIPNLIASFIIYFIHGRDKVLDNINKAEVKFDLLYYTGIAIVLTISEIAGVVFMAISTENFKLSEYVMALGILLMVSIVIESIILWRKRRKNNENKNLPTIDI